MSQCALVVIPTLYKAEAASKSHQCTELSIAKQQFKQLKVAESFDNTKQWDANHPCSMRIDRRVAEMLALDDLAFTFKEGIGFSILIYSLQKRYSLKSRKYYSDTIIPNIENGVASKVTKYVEEFDALAMTTDTWTVKNSAVSLMGLTAHGITPSFERRKIVLCAQELDESHTCEYIEGVFQCMLETWQIPTEKVLLVLRDEGANVKKAMRLADVPHDDCADHQLHLVVSAAIRSRRVITELPAKCHSISGHFNHSDKAQMELTAILQQYNLKKLKLKQNCAT